MKSYDRDLAVSNPVTLSKEKRLQECGESSNPTDSLSTERTDYDTMADEQLIEAFRKGNPSAADYLLNKYKPIVRMRAKALYLIGGDTEDLIQEGMIGLFKAIRDYDSEKKCRFSTFAQLCINRHLGSVLEASQRMKNQPLNNALSFSVEVNPNGERLEEVLSRTGDDPEQLLLEQEKADELYRNLYNDLSKMEKEVLKYYMQGHNYTQIAEIINKTPKSIDNCLQRIRTKLRNLLAGSNK